MQIYFRGCSWFVLFLLLVGYSSLGFGQSFPKVESEKQSNIIIKPEDQKDFLEQSRQCDPPSETPYDIHWNLNNWLTAHAGERSKVITSQSGNKDPAPFKGGNWLEWLLEIFKFRLAWNNMIGPIPHTCVALDPQEEPLGLTPDEEKGIDKAAYTMKKFSYRGAHGERIPTFLLIPNGITQPRPAILVMHQSLPICGKKEPAGVCLQGSSNLDFARDFARKGYVVLAPDSVGFGERANYSWETGIEYSDAAPLLSRFPKATLTGLRISDVERGIDFLRSLSIVDKHHVGMMGHSNGGIETLFSAAYDRRIQCAISNAGPNLIRREVDGYLGLAPGIARWAGFGYLPGLGFFNNDIENLPVEMHQLYAMVAPRGLFLSLIEDDTIAPKNDRIDFAMNQAERAYSAIGGDFAYHTIKSGKTPECRAEWGTAACISDGYDQCVKKGDTACLANYALLGMTSECVARQPSGISYYCAHELFWDDCRQKEGKSESECIARFTGIGMNDACVAQSTEWICRRDHGWYPETEEVAYPWFEECLSRRN